MTVGEAQMNAAADYFGGLAMISPYDEKAGQAPTLYGLPMYRFQTSKPAPPPPPQLPTQTDAVTGLTSASVTTTPAFVLHHTPTGDYYTDGANNPQVTLYQPLEPRSAPTDVTQPGTLAHGVRIDSLVVLRKEPITPHYDRPTADQGANEPSFIPRNAAFPDNVAAGDDGERSSRPAAAGRLPHRLVRGDRGTGRRGRRLADAVLVDRRDGVVLARHRLDAAVAHARRLAGRPGPRQLQHRGV